MSPKKVTWLELFFDLVFVFAVTRTAELLRADHTPLGSVQALIVFVPVFWLWVGTTMHANLHDIDTVTGRLGVFAVALGGLLLALALPDAFHGTGVGFAAAYWAARLILLLAIRGLPHRSAFATFTVGACVTGPLFLVGSLLPPLPRTLVWGVAAALDLSVPLMTGRRLADVPFEASHLSERYGTFIIIALGETIVATAAAASVHELDAARLATLVAAFTAVCGLWWVYFTFSAPAIHAALEAAASPIEIIRPVLSYGHLAFVFGIIGVATAIGSAIEEPRQHLRIDTAALLFGGAAVYLTTFAFTRWHLFHTVATPRLIAAASCLALVALAPHVPALACVVLLATTVIVLNVVEHRVIPTTVHDRRPRAGRDR